ncbi:zinc finger protein 723-like [Pecten maximus]|uniref:zinc finger protein 723-like n=1 Tax=Pecten maximus TaxID=6579 RepID=UPI001458A783|nr:zinc finger protein 723-like [Pecten maximus]
MEESETKCESNIVDKIPAEDPSVYNIYRRIKSEWDQWKHPYNGGGQDMSATVTRPLDVDPNVAVNLMHQDVSNTPATCDTPNIPATLTQQLDGGRNIHLNLTHPFVGNPATFPANLTHPQDRINLNIQTKLTQNQCDKQSSIPSANMPHCHFGNSNAAATENGFPLNCNTPVNTDFQSCAIKEEGIGSESDGSENVPETGLEDEVQSSSERTDETNTNPDSSQSSAKPHKCELCDKRYRTKGLLATHFRVHTGEKPYSCPLCPSRFTTKGSLKNHNLRVHKLKLYTCEVCGKGFNLPGSYHEHLCAHKGEKPYTCEVCGKKFSRLIHIQTHSRTHTGERPHECDICGKRFSHSCDFTKTPSYTYRGTSIQV